MSVTLLAALFIATVARSSWAMGDVTGKIGVEGEIGAMAMPSAGIEVAPGPGPGELQPDATLAIVAADGESPMSPETLKPAAEDTERPACSVPMPGQVKQQYSPQVLAVPGVFGFGVDIDNSDNLMLTVYFDRNVDRQKLEAMVLAIPGLERYADAIRFVPGDPPLPRVATTAGQATQSVITPKTIERLEESLPPQPNFDGSSPQTGDGTSAITPDTSEDAIVVPPIETKLGRKDALLQVRQVYARQVLAVPWVKKFRVRMDPAKDNFMLYVYIGGRQFMDYYTALGRVQSIPGLRQYANDINYVRKWRPASLISRLINYLES